MDWQVLATIIGALFSSQALTIFIQSKFSEGKTKADAASTLVQSMLEWQKTLTDRIVALEQANADKDVKMAEKDSKIDELQARVAHLESEITKRTKGAKKKVKSCRK